MSTRAASPDQSADVDRQKSEAEQAANTSTITSAETGPAAPQVAEALLASIQQADTDETAAELASPLPAVAISSDQRHNSNSANSEAESDSDTDASSEAGTEACESDDSDQLLAQLSESMWASLRPEPLSQHSSGLPSSSGQAQDAGGQLQPLSAQQHYTAGCISLLSALLVHA